jgi:hypothetical protein
MKKSELAPVLAGVLAAVATSTALHVLGSLGAVAPDVDPAAAAMAGTVARLERRLSDVEHKLRLAAEFRAEPAAVTRVAEERGLEVDDAWNAYFDEIVTRLQRLEERLEGADSPAILEAVEQATLAQMFAQPSNATTLFGAEVLGSNGAADSLARWMALAAVGRGGWIVNQGATDDFTLLWNPAQPRLTNRALFRRAALLGYSHLGDGKFVEVGEPFEVLPTTPDDAAAPPDSEQ